MELPICSRSFTCIVISIFKCKNNVKFRDVKEVVQDQSSSTWSTLDSNPHL